MSEQKQQQSQPASVQSLKAVRVRTVVPVQFGGVLASTVRVADKDTKTASSSVMLAEAITLTPSGAALVKYAGGEVLVPSSNIAQVDVAR